jgi:hypothetical protein
MYLQTPSATVVVGYDLPAVIGTARAKLFSQLDALRQSTQQSSDLDSIRAEYEHTLEKLTTLNKEALVIADLITEQARIARDASVYVASNSPDEKRLKFAPPDLAASCRSLRSAQKYFGESRQATVNQLEQHSENLQKLSNMIISGVEKSAMLSHMLSKKLTYVVTKRLETLDTVKALTELHHAEKGKYVELINKSELLEKARHAALLGDYDQGELVKHLHPEVLALRAELSEYQEVFNAKQVSAAKTAREEFGYAFKAYRKSAGYTERNINIDKELQQEVVQ